MPSLQELTCRCVLLDGFRSSWFAGESSRSLVSQPGSSVLASNISQWVSSPTMLVSLLSVSCLVSSNVACSLESHFSSLGGTKDASRPRESVSSSSAPCWPVLSVESLVVSRGWQNEAQLTLAVGLSKMNGVGGKAGWSWIVSSDVKSSLTNQFIIEGLLTTVIGCISPWMVHDWPDQARFLTTIEKEMVLGRLKADSGLASEGKFHKSVVFGALREWKVCLLLSICVRLLTHRPGCSL